MSDAAGRRVWTAEYDPFGQATVNEDPDGDGKTSTLNLRFSGQYFDLETSLHYNYFRDYDPALGRYVQSDPIGLRGGLNTYSYVGDNPLKYIDPLGLRTEVTIWQPVGWGESSFGHVSTDINGTTFSFGPNGMWTGSSSDYNSKNSFRDGSGQLINLTPEQEAKLKACLSGDQGKYSETSNNCGKPIERCLKDLGIDTGSPMLPVDLGNKLIDSGATKGSVDHPATNPSSGTNAPWAR